MCRLFSHIPTSYSPTRVALSHNDKINTRAEMLDTVLYLYVMSTINKIKNACHAVQTILYAELLASFDKYLGNVWLYLIFINNLTTKLKNVQLFYKNAQGMCSPQFWKLSALFLVNWCWQFWQKPADSLYVGSPTRDSFSQSTTKLFFTMSTTFCK